MEGIIIIIVMEYSCVGDVPCLCRLACRSPARCLGPDEEALYYGELG